MLTRWIWLANYALGGIVVILSLILLASVLTAPAKLEEPQAESEAQLQEKVLPQPTLRLPEEAYEAIGEPVLTSEVTAPPLQLPDLRPVLVYYGTNSRPDASSTKMQLHFGIAGGQSLASVAPGEPLYLQYDRTQTPGRYMFSPENRKTGLYIEATTKGTEAHVKVTLKDEHNDVVTEPRARLEFSLPEKELARFSGGTWEIGKFRVDGTLLARQRARWFGQDLFLNRHGGAEYAALAGRERLEFGEGDERYSVYVGVDECLAWDGKQWRQAKSLPNTQSYPLLCVKKIEERLMRLELWDVDGKGRMALNLLKSTEAWAPQVLAREFKFVSARTLSQYVFDVRKGRMTLKPFDWLLLTDGGWKPLTSPEEIDDYVERRTPGILFVFQGAGRAANDRPVLLATLYSSSRSSAEELQIPMEQSLSPGKPSTKIEQEKGESAEKPPIMPETERVLPLESHVSSPQDNIEPPCTAPTSENINKEF